MNQKEPQDKVKNHVNSQNYDNYDYFKAFRGCDYPIYLKCQIHNFPQEFFQFLTNLGFEKIDDNKKGAVDLLIKRSPHSRVLVISEVSHMVARQIENSVQNGEEIIQKEGYKIYGHKKNAIIIYSMLNQEWQMAIYPHFAMDIKEIKGRTTGRTVFNRFLSWALAPLGIVGFWGKISAEGMIVLKPDEAEGEAVFFDIKKGVFLTIDGSKKVKSDFKFIRIDRTLKTNGRFMGKEELLSFLTHYCTFLDNIGVTIPIRQMIQTLVKSIPGIKQQLEAGPNKSINSIESF
jgi:hypothetical protein